MTESSKHVVCIAGKRNVDKLSDKLLNKEKPQRTRTMKWTIDDTFFDYNKQLEVLRRLIADDTSLEERNFFKKEIKHKLVLLFFFTSEIYLKILLSILGSVIIPTKSRSDKS